MASLLKTMNKFVKENMVLIIALLIGVVGIGVYSFTKTPNMDAFACDAAEYNEVKPEVGEGEMKKEPKEKMGPAPHDCNKNYLPVNGKTNGANGLPPVNKNVNVPKDLLPGDKAQGFDKPTTEGLNGISMITPNEQIGTVTSCMRNSSLDIRGDCALPQKMDTGPWNQTTIESCQMRRGMDLTSC
jgi:hypothetical protein